jgi:preprotein translocase subunit SecY
MLQALFNIFRIPELRNRVFFTIGMLLVYRIGFWIPLPGVDQTHDGARPPRRAAEQDTGGFGRFLDYASIFSGGSFMQITIFGLGIMPYITAAIIFQLLQRHSALAGTEEGRRRPVRRRSPSGRAMPAVGMCVIQAFMWLQFLIGAGHGASRSSSRRADDCDVLPGRRDRPDCRLDLPDVAG